MLFIEIIKGNCSYEHLGVEKDFITKSTSQWTNYDCNKDAEKPSKVKKKVKFFMDGVLAHYFIQELLIAPSYRNAFLDHFYKTVINSSTINSIKIILLPTSKEIVDYGWNYRITYLVREKCELEHTLSWLSTLGGAFSALGDYFENCAEVAGKISLNQLYLAFRLGDPNTVAKCRLYLSLSLIQRRQFKLAKRIVYTEYINGKNDRVVDIRLLNMCKGIWCKLKYDYSMYKKEKLTCLK